MDDIPKKHINPLAAGLTGMIIGAGAGVVATKVLSDKKTRDKLMHMASDMGEQISHTIKKAGREALKRKEAMENQFRATAHRIRLGQRRKSRRTGRSKLASTAM